MNARFLKKNSIDKVLGKIMLVPLFVGVALIFSPPHFWCVTGLFFLFLCCCGMIFPNTSAAALANHAKHSGSAAALLGTIQFAIAATSSFVISEFYDGDISVITLVVGACGVGAFLLRRIFSKGDDY
jgi:DHA1 family bicyclomycin/chloramphenicol resistance-like MFS transporter